MVRRSRNVSVGSPRVTLADLCRAIAEGELPARQQGHWYSIRKRDVVDYLARLSPQMGLATKAS